jgi:hypothetical protein
VLRTSITVEFMENMVQPAEVRIYKVTESNLGILQAKIAKLNRRAAKLGVSPVVITTVDTSKQFEIQSDVAGDRRSRFVDAQVMPRSNEHFTGRVRILNHITVNGTTPKLAGWEFIGKIETVSDESGKVIGNLLRLVPGVEAPASYRNTAPWCDHCNVNRRWSETFIIRHENGTHKQVGRRCIADFLGGLDPAQAAAFAELILTIDELASDAEGDDFGDGGGRVPTMYDVETLLQMTACHVRTDGWVSKSKAMFGQPSTSENVLRQINARTEKEQLVWLKHEVTEGDRKTAADTIEWLEGLSMDDTNEYRYALALLGKAGVIRSNQTGLLCSAVSAMLRDREQEINRRLRADKHAQSTFLGAVKQRMVFADVVVELIKYIESDFGTTTLYTFIDSNSNVIKWFASNSLEIDGTPVEVGQVVTIKATVKSHSTYQDVKQTMVSRAALYTEKKKVA